MSLHCVWRLGLRGKDSCNERHNRVSIWVQWQGSQVSKRDLGHPSRLPTQLVLTTVKSSLCFGTDVSEINWWVPQVSL
jgi:hypothetical protein